MSDSAAVLGIRFGAIYVTDFQECDQFYRNVLGLQVHLEVLPGQVLFYRLGDTPWGLMLCKSPEEGSRMAPDRSHLSFTLSVKSAGALFARLKEAQVESPQSTPNDVGDGDFWFQFFDPAGNLLEVVGGA